MTWRLVTEHGLAILIGVAIIYDVFVVFFNKEQGDSITRVFRHWGRQFFAIWLCLGVVVGHLAWQWPSVISQPWAAVVLGTVGVAVGVVGYRYRLAARRWKPLPIVLVLIGIGLGGLLWSPIG